MASINMFVGVGRLVREVETKQIRPGLTAGKFTLAIEHQMRKKDGTVEKEVCFIDCTVWNQQAIEAEQLKKGSEIFVKGRLKLDQWEDKNTKEKKSKHTIMVDTIMHNFSLDSQAISMENAFEPVAKQKSVTMTHPGVKQQVAQQQIKQQLEEPSFDDNLPF